MNTPWATGHTLDALLPHQAHASSQRPTVLLLDDEASIRQALGRYLELSGFTVLYAANPDEAFGLAARHEADAFVLDVRLPGARSGLEVLEFVRLDDDGADRPVIVLTGNVLTDEEEEIIRRYSAYVFYKPHGSREIADRLQQICLTARAG